jgi:hypothetical protein
MNKSEWLKLAEALAGSTPTTEMPASAVPGGMAASPLQSGETGDDVAQRIEPVISPTNDSRRTESSVPAGVEVLLRAVAESRSAGLTGAVATRSLPSSGRDDSGPASSVLKTAGMIAGVGPVITGLVKLFGGGGEPEAASYSPTFYSLPEQVAVEAGLRSDRSIGEVTYASNGSARTTPSGGSQSVQSSTPIQINVQAMDSRSFVDHSDEIARAVRDALLRSHTLSDVIAEM